MASKSTPAKTLPDSALQLDHQLCFALYSSSQAMTQLYRPLLSALDLTYPQYLVLLLLWEHDGQSVSALGERLYLDSGTLTPLLKRMEAKGLLERRRSAQDERRVEIFLTTAGRQLRNRAAKIPGCVLDAAACPLPELIALTQQLQSLRQRLLAA